MVEISVSRGHPLSSPGPGYVEQASTAAYGFWSSVWGAGDDFSG
jgi:hypothetical protein